jgi:hypothetical protein
MRSLAAYEELIIGIDPGVKGGIALLTDTGRPLGTLDLTARTESMVADSFKTWAAHYPGAKVFIEKEQHIKGDGAGGSFTFGSVYGLLRGLAWAHFGRPRYVYPMTWQSALGCMTSGAKNISKDKARELFSVYDMEMGRWGITHAIADALLIAEYGRRLLAREAESLHKI